MKPYDHAVSSAKQFGGKPEDYLEIHNFMDSSKAHIADGRHRAILHSSFGIFITEKVFGVNIINEEGELISVRDVAEQHVLEDLGTIPTVADWLKELPIKSWMANRDPKSLDTSPVALLSNLNKEMKQKSEELMQPFIKDLESKLAAFLNDNDIDGVVWVQYTPGFNDGDPCEFGICGPTFCIKSPNTLDDEDEDSTYGSEGFIHNDIAYISLPWADPRSKIKMPTDLSDAFDLEEVFEAAFGNGAKCYITKDEGKLHFEDYDCGY